MASLHGFLNLRQPGLCPCFTTGKQPSCKEERGLVITLSDELFQFGFIGVTIRFGRIFFVDNFFLRWR